MTTPNPRSLFSIIRNRRRVNEHTRSMRICWPDWEGPRVEDSVHGRCQVNSGCCHSITHGGDRYHYMAPVKITEIRPDGSGIGFIDYPADCHCSDMNGEQVLLQPDEIWPPVQEMWAIRHAEELVEFKAAGHRCKCGGEPAHRYGGTFICQACADENKARLEASIKPKRKPKRSP